MHSCTTLPVTACLCCCHGNISNTVQSYNIITTYPNITILKNVKRVKIVVLWQKNRPKRHPPKKRYSYTSMEMTAGIYNYIVI